MFRKKNLWRLLYWWEIQTFSKMIKKISRVIGKKKKVIFKNTFEPRNNQIVISDKLIRQVSFSQSLNLLR